jgi:hypothetical protein
MFGLVLRGLEAGTPKPELPYTLPVSHTHTGSTSVGTVLVVCRCLCGS